MFATERLTVTSIEEDHLDDLYATPTQIISV